MGKPLQIKDLHLRYPGQGENAVHDLNLSIEAGEIVSLIGPSGSGKSSFLKLLAGLEIPSQGTIYLGDECISNCTKCLPPEKRRIGLVSQGGDLFPHLTVGRNVAYGLFRLPRGERSARVEELLEMVELSHLADRFPAELSGGEAQRISLARALAPRPSVVLLDEPFSSLDPDLRERLRGLTIDLLRKEKTTSIFVTHHLEDASSHGGRILALSEGKLVSGQLLHSECSFAVTEAEPD